MTRNMKIRKSVLQCSTSFHVLRPFLFRLFKHLLEEG
jgi:hypothetical protein